MSPRSEKHCIEEDMPHAHPFTPTPDNYRDELSQFDLTEAQQIELVQSLWRIMSMMVDMGWGVDSVQILLPDLFNDSAEKDKALPRNPANDNNEESHNKHR